LPSDADHCFVPLPCCLPPFAAADEDELRGTFFFLRLQQLCSEKRREVNPCNQKENMKQKKNTRKEKPKKKKKKSTADEKRRRGRAICKKSMVHV